MKDRHRATRMGGQTGCQLFPSSSIISFFVRNEHRPKAKPLSQKQVERTKMKFGPEKRANDEQEYELLLENHLEFIQVEIISGTDQSSLNSLLSLSFFFFSSISFLE